MKRRLLRRVCMLLLGLVPAFGSAPVVPSAGGDAMAMAAAGGCNDCDDGGDMGPACEPICAPSVIGVLPPFVQAAMLHAAPMAMPRYAAAEARVPAPDPHPPKYAGRR